MGMYDHLIFKCRCGYNMETQTKVLGGCNLDTFIVGIQERDEIVSAIRGVYGSIFEEKLFNCLFKVKERCPNCGAQNVIKIVEGVLKEIVKDKNELMLIELNDEYVKEEERFGGIV